MLLANQYELALKTIAALLEPHQLVETIKQDEELV